MQVWKVLAQTVPATAKTPEVIEMEDYFRELIRGVDSSLLDEWERLKDPAHVAAEASAAPAQPSSVTITRDPAEFRRLVRLAILGFLQDVAARDWSAAQLRLGADAVKPSDEAAMLAEARRIERAFAPYFETHPRFRLDPEGRAAKHTHIDENGGAEATWSIAQILADPEGENDWEARFTISLAESRAANRVVLAFHTVARVGE